MVCLTVTTEQDVSHSNFFVIETSNVWMVAMNNNCVWMETICTMLFQVKRYIYNKEIPSCGRELIMDML